MPRPVKNLAQWAAVTVLLCFFAVTSSPIVAAGDRSSGPIGGSKINSAQQPVTIITPDAAAQAEKVLSANATPGAGGNIEDYRIAPLDVIEVSVYGQPDLTQTVQVPASGIISLPLVKKVQAGGRTAAQVEADVEAALGAKFLQNPQVTVLVKEFNSQRVTVDGAVSKPGIFPVTGPTTLQQSIALAGGLTYYANPSGVIVFRTVQGKRMAARYDLSEIRAGQKEDPALLAGDIVIVDDSTYKSAVRGIVQTLPITGLFSLFAL